MGGPKAVERQQVPPRSLRSMEGLPSPLSSRAKPRDLRFNGPLMEMFSLLLQNGFHQVARIVDVDAVLNCQLVGEQLQGNDLQHGG